MRKLNFNLFIFICLVVFGSYFSLAFADFYGEDEYGSGYYSGNNSTTTVPGIPNIVNVVAGDSQATLSFSPPSSNGGSVITSYTVTSTPGNISRSGLSSPIIIDGLTNGVSYTFTIFAINSVGASSVATSSSVIPFAQDVISGGSSGRKRNLLQNPTIIYPQTHATTSTTQTNTSEITKSQDVTFTRDLQLSLTGEDARMLQKFLNLNGFIVSPTGVGSIGNESTYFGELTRQALIKFQVKYRISPPVGYFGKNTRTKVLELISNGQTNETHATTSTTQTNTSEITKSQDVTFTRDLQLSLTGEDVRMLQKFLNLNGFIVSPTGVGSIGNESTYFGELTRQALIKFQVKYRISPPVGYFGKNTRTKVLELISNGQ